MAGELDRLSQVATDLLDGKTEVIVSAVSIWEVAIKRSIGKLEAPPDLLAQLTRAGLQPLAISAAHADRVGSLPLHHRDPFDRLLIAQAQLEAVSLVSADGPMRRYEVEVIW